MRKRKWWEYVTYTTRKYPAKEHREKYGIQKYQDKPLRKKRERPAQLTLRSPNATISPVTNMGQYRFRQGLCSW